MTSRIPNIFNKNKSKNKKTFISYLVCGDPSKEITLSAMDRMSKSSKIAIVKKHDILNRC